MGAMPIVPVTDAADPRLADYRHVPDPELLRQGAIFVAEGRLVVRALVAGARFRTRSILVTETAWRSVADAVEPRLDTLDVYLATSGVVEALTGFDMHRGCLAIGERPAPTGLEAMLDTLPDARRVVVLEQVSNADNLGGIFRNAAAFGASAVVLGPHCCDPLYRKATRVSMGATLHVPFAEAGSWPGALDALRARGFRVAALTPRPGGRSLGDYAGALPAGERVAVLAGSEGPGLSTEAVGRADATVRIPMAPGVDSLNVATAVGIALYDLRGQI
jgi:tRNA G18 (ribose-2'-O)-methylase SpoU